MPEESKKEETKPTYKLSPQEQALLCGDLSQLSEAQRADLVMKVCESTGLNVWLRPFQYIKTKEGGLVLYATKSATEQLRQIHNVSLTFPEKKEVGDAYIVTAQATLPSGRIDSSTGAVSIKGLGGDNLCNALMKAETKAKRRVTLSVCGLGILDESEIETIAGAQILPPVSLPQQAQALPAASLAPTVAQAQGKATGEAAFAEVYAAGKKIGKLAGTVNADLQRLGGDVFGLRAEYEKAIAEKNPRGGSQGAPPVAAPVDEPAFSNASAVDGEAGNYDANAEYEKDLASGAPLDKDNFPTSTKSDAPESDKVKAVMDVMRAFLALGDLYGNFDEQMKLISRVLGRTVTKHSELEPVDCAKVVAECEKIAATLAPPATEATLVANEGEITQLQIELKDAKFVEWLKTSKAYKAASEGGANQADSLRAARLAFAKHVIGREIASYNELTSEECKKLFAKCKEMKSK